MVSRGDAGDLEIRHDGADGAIDLVYAPGNVERLGTTLSGGAVIVWLVLCGRTLARQARRQREESAASRTEARTTPATS